MEKGKLLVHLKRRGGKKVLPRGEKALKGLTFPRPKRFFHNNVKGGGGGGGGRSSFHHPLLEGKKGVEGPIKNK